MVACGVEKMGCCYELGIGARLRLVVVKYGRMNVMARPRLAEGCFGKRVVWASKGM